MIFQGIQTSIAKEPYGFVILQWASSPPLWLHACPAYKELKHTYPFLDFFGTFSSLALINANTLASTSFLSEYTWIITKLAYRNLTLCLLESSADNLYKQFGPRSGPIECWSWSGSKMFGTLKVFLKEIFFENWLWKNSANSKKHVNLHSRKIVKSLILPIP